MEKHNIYHRRDGRWEGRIPRGKKPDGTRRFQYIFGHTKEEVRQKMREILSRETCLGDCDRTLSELFAEWLLGVRSRVKESTAANYIMKAEKHILPAFGEKTPGEIFPSDVLAFMENKLKNGLSGRYVSDILILMKTLFKYIHKTYHVTNPMENVSLPRKKKPEIRLLDEEEQNRLQRYVSENRSRATLGIALSLSTGIRIGELCALQWADVDLKKRVLTVRKTLQRIRHSGDGSKTKLVVTEPKSESSFREIPIPECLSELLSEYQGRADEYILSGKEKPAEPRTMQYRFSRILKNAKLPSVHFHALRHMFATNCVRLGFDAKALSEILGHSSVEITLNRYVHSPFEQKRRYMELVKLAF